MRRLKVSAILVVSTLLHHFHLFHTHTHTPVSHTPLSRTPICPTDEPVDGRLGPQPVVLDHTSGFEGLLFVDDDLLGVRERNTCNCTREASSFHFKPR